MDIGTRVLYRNSRYVVIGSQGPNLRIRSLERSKTHHLYEIGVLESAVVSIASAPAIKAGTQEDRSGLEGIAVAMESEPPVAPPADPTKALVDPTNQNNDAGSVSSIDVSGEADSSASSVPSDTIADHAGEASAQLSE